MSAAQLQKSGIEEWLHWAEVTVDRLTDCVHVYKNPPYIDVFMPDTERQQKTDKTVKLLRSIYAIVDQASLNDTPVQDEAVISALVLSFEETLQRLPALSDDMQKLLKSPWMSHFPNKIAETLFAGPHGIESEGIGSGQIEHGRLPASLAALLEREEMGDIRAPRTASASAPQRHDVEGHSRWVQQNGKFLRSAGRVE